MRQYNSIKAKYPDTILLFRVGDFYETFGSDAVETSSILGIVLTKKSNGASGKIDLAGFPHHSINTYLQKLVKAGKRVAICDQLEDPKKTKTIVKRGVTEIVTPGVSLNDEVLISKSNNFLAAIYFGKKNIGIAFLDISTGEFMTSQGNENYIKKLIVSLSPKEIIYQKQLKSKFDKLISNGNYSYPVDDWAFNLDFANDKLNSLFGTKSLKGFGIENIDNGVVSCGAILSYLSDIHQNEIGHIKNIKVIRDDSFLWMDGFTITNLEIFPKYKSLNSFLNVIDKTITPMGGRNMKNWVAFPLINKKNIENRLDCVEFFVKNRELLHESIEYMKFISDLERLSAKISTEKISPKEVVYLRNSLEYSLKVKSILSDKTNSLQSILNEITDANSTINTISNTINDDAPVLVSKGNVVKTGVSKELDNYRELALSGKDYLDKMCKRLSEQTGISSLKISFNNVFGYYIEVRNAHKNKVPETWNRKQTLTNAERYITEELKEYEQKILSAQGKIFEIEQVIFNDLVMSLKSQICDIQHIANAIANIDCLVSFARVSIENNYTRPNINDSKELNIVEGRHPVIEKNLTSSEEYISNNVFLDDKTQQIIMITGPNMSGKSAILRQTALIVIMAQIGCFVSAKNAEIGIVDSIFTRVGASDNISSGESTFMVEMNETANIINNITDRSLILLDEIGRGTSTYDGISIAWAIAEYLHQSKQKPKTLFATHYHELNEMKNDFGRIKNYNISVKELGDKIIFLRKLTPGGSNHSFGINVAKMAGIPSSITKRASEILSQLESSKKDKNSEINIKSKIKKEDIQLNIFELNDPLLDSIKSQLKNIEINNLTPIEALVKLSKIKNLLN